MFIPRTYQKLSPEKIPEILNYIKNGNSYRDTVKYLKEKYDIEVSSVAICHLVAKTKEYLTPEFMTSQMDDARKSDLAVSVSLSATLEIVMEMYEEMIRDLNAKRNSEEGLKKGDMMLLFQVSDRLMKLKQIVSPTTTVSREISFTSKNMAKDYHVE
jgi:hypothetical protein